MQDKDKTKQELIRQLRELHRRVQDLEESEYRYKRAKERIKPQAEFLHLVLESIPHPFYVIDAADYTIRLANSATHKGHLSKDVTCYALTHKSDRPCGSEAHPCPLETVKNTKKPVTVEHVHYDRNGNPRNVEVHAYPIFDSEGNVSQVIESGIDITERKLAEEALKKSSEQVKMLAYSVLHDLKNPAIGIYGLTKLLHRQYENSLDERAKGYCDQILKAADHISSLVANINFYISTKETAIYIESIKFREVLQIVRDEFSAQLDLRQIRWSQPEGVPDICGHRSSILRALRNLVDNALKYGGDALSEIRIGYEASDEFHTLSVSDDGVGIKKEDPEKIFGLFQRHETSRGIEGTGLGLAIVKEVAEQHGGRAWVESGPEKGITFHLSISRHLSLQRLLGSLYARTMTHNLL
jgi:signal transduction histidine kinase